MIRWLIPAMLMAIGATLVAPPQSRAETQPLKPCEGNNWPVLGNDGEQREHLSMRATALRKAVEEARHGSGPQIVVHVTDCRFMGGSIVQMRFDETKASSNTDSPPFIGMYVAAGQLQALEEGNIPGFAKFFVCLLKHGFFEGEGRKSSDVEHPARAACGVMTSEVPRLPIPGRDS